MGEVVSRLATRGLVEVKNNPKIRHSISIWFTEQGKTVLEKAMQHMDLLNEHLVANLTIENADLVNKLLTNIAYFAYKFRLPDSIRQLVRQVA